jgi:hypothetical protein
MRKIVAACGVALTLAAASTPAGPPHSPEAQAKLDKLLNGRVAGEQRACIPVDSTKSAIAIDESTIVFRDGPRIWLNNLRAGNGCSMIGHPYAMETESHVRQVCSGTTINVLDLSEAGGGAAVGACVLGDFVLYSKP